MKKILALLCSLMMVFTLGACGQTGQDESSQVPVENSSQAEASSESVNSSETTLPLSDRIIRVTCGDLSATFQLYDTTAAAELYEQLPLELELSNFADAQWMFYPPEELSVTDAEIYKDGKKGELSYYEPWGDVFMLYEDFQSGDDMHRLGVGLEGIDNIAGMSGTVRIEQINDAEDPQVSSESSEIESEPAETVPAQEPQQSEGEETMQISVEGNGSTIVFELNDSQAARDLYEQLPLSIEVENFSNNEKIFYPPEGLDTSDTPLAEGGAGTLAYYAPWGDVVMFYGGFGSNGSLFELGEAVSGSEQISGLTGTIEISVYE